MYKITIKKIAAKELDHLPKKILILVTKSIFSLANIPRPVGCKKLKGTKVELWRISKNLFF